MTSSMVVAVATRDRPEGLARLLDSIERCERPTELAGVLVVDNAPRRPRGTSAVEGARRTIAVRRLHHPFGGKSGALNCALAESSEGDLLVFVDDDVELARGALAAYAAAARGVASGRMFGGDVEVAYEQEPEGWLRGYLPKSALGHRPRDADLTFLGANWAAFVGDLKAVGGFDVHLGPGSDTGATGQESDAQRRLRALGVRPVYVEGAVVTHRVARACCTPRWVLDRARREGIHDGLADARTGLAPPFVGDLPIDRELVSRRAAHVLRALAARLRKDERAAFDVAFEAAYLEGFLLGCRRARDTSRPR